MNHSLLLVLLVSLAAVASAQAQLAGESPYPRAAALSVDAKRAAAGEAIGAMKAAVAETEGRVEAAREAKDLVRLNCVGDKLTAIKGLLAVSQAAGQAFGEAAAAGDATLIDHAFTRISVAGDQVARLRLAVEGCVGETARYAGETSVALDVEPGIRSDDPSRTVATPVFVPVNVDRPPAVSGSR